MPKDDLEVATINCTTLFESDLKLLETPNWLNDRIIDFYFEYFAHENQCFADVLLFVPSPTVFMIMNIDDCAPLIAELNISSRQVVVLPLNDNDDLEQQGGQHWTLLVYHKPSNTFYFFDSCPCASNKQHAKRLATKMQQILQLSTVQFEQVQIPRQQNGYDCGAHVMVIAELVSQSLLTKHQLPKQQEFEGFGNHIAAYNVRSKFKNIIHELIKSQQQ